MTMKWTNRKKPTTGQLLDEAYLLILTRRPSPAALAAALGIPIPALGRALRRLSKDLVKSGLRVASAGTGIRKQLQIEALGGPKGKAVDIDPASPKVRTLPANRPGLKVDDKIVYARDW